MFSRKFMARLSGKYRIIITLSREVQDMCEHIARSNRLLTIVAVVMVSVHAHHSTFGALYIEEFQCSADTTLLSSYPDSEYSADPWLTWDTHGGTPSGVYQSLLRFDDLFSDNGGPIPSGKPLLIESAILRLQESAGGPGEEALVHRMLRDWSATDTWNIHGDGIQADDVEAASIPDASTGYVTPNQLIEIDVLTSLRAWALNPSQNFGWVLLPSGNDGVAVYSSDALVYTVRPRLEVTWIPEPATLSLLALGGLAITRRSRRSAWQ